MVVTPGPTARSNGSELPGLAARKAAARLLAAVIEAKTALDGLTDNEHGHPQFRTLDPRDRSLVRAILASALRHRVSIESLIESRLDRPLPARAGMLSHILHVAAAQILFLDVPDSAAVNLAVAHAGEDPRTRRFAGLVNAVLRELARRKERSLPKVLATTLDAPAWLLERLSQAYGADKAAAIVAMHRAEASLDFTVKSDPPGWAERLGGRVLPTGSVRVARIAGAITELPGYGDGEWWVQDAASALPTRLLGNVAGRRVADLCAAPGGKTAQLAAAGASVTAIDSSKNRLKRLAANLDRLKLDAEIVHADLAAWTPETPFDAVLLDAPCSSTGTIRRHPDVAWTKSPEDIEKLAAVQRRLLEAAVKLVRPGGLLVFSNCSLDPAEGETLVANFLADHAEVERAPVAPDEIAGIDGLLDANGDLRTTPAGWPAEDPREAGLDGFFAARLRRKG
ncbi:RsmB/NOP family class I SAM-dependent RNA methyltransferase [Nitratireductor mangrovi]|uniref:RsmB/NOP family class I SAM-dependent RNA methyltransferase n=1 Tax=Nitratireductor mangrovi TaxID=2599600 RepID=UPI001FEDB462|nr:RsmB/NOP family class I SAM-dependent RNA methyltransferase [Nitratireductor mangrovi]